MIRTDILNMELTPEIYADIVRNEGTYIAKNKGLVTIQSVADAYGEIRDLGLIPEKRQLYHRLSLDAAQVDATYAIFNQKFDKTTTAAEGYWRTNCPWDNSRLTDSEICFARAWSVVMATNESVADTVNLIQSSAGAVVFKLSDKTFWRELMVNMPAARGTKMDGATAAP